MHRTPGSRPTSASRSRSGTSAYTQARAYGHTSGGARRSHTATGHYAGTHGGWSSQARNFQALQIQATKPGGRAGTSANAYRGSYGRAAYGAGTTHASSGGRSSSSRPLRPSSAHPTTHGRTSGSGGGTGHSHGYASRPGSAPRMRQAAGQGAGAGSSSRGAYGDAGGTRATYGSTQERTTGVTYGRTSTGRPASSAGAYGTHATASGARPGYPVKAFGSTHASDGAASASANPNAPRSSSPRAAAAVAAELTPTAAAAMGMAGGHVTRVSLKTEADSGGGGGSSGTRVAYTGGAWAGSNGAAQRTRPSSAGAYRTATGRAARPQSARPSGSAGSSGSAGGANGVVSNPASGSSGGHYGGHAARPSSATTRGHGSGSDGRGYGFNGTAATQQHPGHGYGHGQAAAPRPQSAAAYVSGGSGRSAAAALRSGSGGSSGHSSGHHEHGHHSHSGSVHGEETPADAEARAQHEWQQRQRLRRIVSSPTFDGRATTDFYKFGKVLGQGSFGKVRLAAHKLSGVRVAVKSYEKSKLQNPSHWRRAQQEIALMERMNHVHIIRMLECIESPKRVHIVMEFAGGGNLCQYVKARRRLPEPEARAIFCQVLLGVEYLHNVGIIHRDIKLENILFDDNRQMKLVDFGFSVGCRDPTKKLKIFCGTPSYMAPEIVMRQEYLGRPVDVWSMGVLLYAMLCGVFPFVAKSYPELYKKIVQAQLRLPDHLSHAVKDLLSRMLNPDATKRLTLAQVRRHAWAAMGAVAALRAVRTPAKHSFVIADDPSEDLDETVIKKVEDMSFNREALVKAVLSRVRNHYTTVYYLVLYRLGRSNLPDDAGARPAGTPADFARPRSAQQRPASASAARPPASASSSGTGAATATAQHTRQQRPMSAAPRKQLEMAAAADAKAAENEAKTMPTDVPDDADVAAETPVIIGGSESAGAGGSVGVDSDRGDSGDAGSANGDPDGRVAAMVGSAARGIAAAGSAGAAGAAGAGTATFSGARNGPVAARHDLGLANGAAATGGWTGVRSSSKYPDGGNAGAGSSGATMSAGATTSAGSVGTGMTSSGSDNDASTGSPPSAGNPAHSQAYTASTSLASTSPSDVASSKGSGPTQTGTAAATGSAATAKLLTAMGQGSAPPEAAATS